MKDLIRLVLGRVVGAGVAAGAAYATAKGLGEIAPGCQDQLATAITTGATLAVYGVVHKVTDRKAAKPAEK